MQQSLELENGAVHKQDSNTKLFKLAKTFEIDTSYFHKILLKPTRQFLAFLE